MPEKLKVLVVDDEADIRDVIRLTLEEEGYEVFEAACGQEAVDQAKKVKPNLIVLDFTLPDFNGDRVCELLKEDEENRKIPVLLLTGRDEAAEVQKAMECGANAYQAKPFEPKQLVALLGTLVNTSKFSKKWEKSQWQE